MFINLAVLYLECDKQKYNRSLPVLQAYLEKLKFCNKTLIVIDNSNEEKEIEKISKNYYRLGGDNSIREFSGWQKGLDFLNSSNFNYDIILFVNDSFLCYDGSFLKKANILTVIKALINNSVIGQIDYHNEKVELLGYDTTEWIRTNCFFVPKKIIKDINNVYTVDNEKLNEFIDEDYCGRYFKEDAPLSNNLKEIIVKWLTQEWHSKFKIEDNWQLFRNKTGAMFNESLLSARIKEKGYKIQNFYRVRG